MSKKKSQHRVLPATLGVLLVAGIIVIVLFSAQYTSPALGPIATGDPTLIANLTKIPLATPLAGSEAQQWHDFQLRVDSCSDYSDQRRTQMGRYIEWTLNPAAIPSDLLMIFGANPAASLIRAMAMDTSTEWRLKKRPASSCLIDIGRTLNEMLAGTGQEPLTIYDEDPA